MKGVDLYTVSKLMGHYSTEVTERYAHLASDHLQRAVDSLAIPSAEVTPKLTPASAAPVLNALAIELENLTEELNTARLEGFLAEALARAT
jgi:hypothetical protein